MIAHTIEHYDDDIVTSNNMAFDHQDSMPMMTEDAPKQQQHCHPVSRLVSQPCNEYDAPPHLVASCSTEEDAITGQYTNIEYKYHIDPHVLGVGHHGSVRTCIDRATGGKYAVKSIYKHDPSVKAAGLAREISLLQDMKHESIISLVDVFEDVDYVHLVTNLCEGGELFDKICELSSNSDNGTPCFQESEAARIMYQLLQSVSYMHKKGIVHRDIKPENILFETTSNDSPIKIIDFGLSRRHAANLDKPMSTLVGTPYYIAPEVLKKRYENKCDLWSVGVIAYILLCGYPPFNGKDNEATHRSVLRGKYYFPAEDWSNISRDAMDFIVRLLQMNPKKRMTIEQALNHPWIVQHTTNANVSRMEEEQVVQDRSCVEVVYNASPPPPPKKKAVERTPSPRTRTYTRKMMMASTYSVLESPPQIHRVKASTFSF